MVSHVRSFLLMSVLANYGSECHSRPNSGFGVAENDAAGSSLFTTAGTRGRAKSANGGMEFQHFPRLRRPSRHRKAGSQSRRRAKKERSMADGWTNDRTSGQPASDQPAGGGGDRLIP